MKRVFAAVAVVALSAGMAVGAEKIDEKALRQSAKAQLGVLPKEMPAPKNNPTTKEKVELGKMLYFEPRLSKSQSISCNTCHNLAAAGDDNLPRSLGHESQLGGRNAPTVLNAGFQFRQFWDGRSASLEQQAAGPITNPVEMAMPSDAHGKEVLAVVKSMPEYRERFAKVFGSKPEPVTMENITRAIAAFERTLVSPSRFDTWLKGDNKALTAAEKRGLKAFLDVGCAGCHRGPAIGGQDYQKMGLVKPYPNQSDLGRYEVTGKEEDKMMFKVPLLRNINRTPPYFHDAAVWELKDAVEVMAEFQLGRQLEDQTVSDIVSFLKALDGQPIKMTLPALPPRTSDTPKPTALDPVLTPAE